MSVPGWLEPRALTLPIGVSLALAPLMVLAHMLLCRARRDRQGLKELAGAFGLYALLTACVLPWAACRAHVPLDGMSWLAAGALDAALGLLYMEFYSLLYRGFSLNILVALESHGGMDEEALMRRYGGGQGADGLLRRRIEGLEAFKLVQSAAGGVRLASRLAGWLGHSGIVFKRVLNLGPGG